MLLKITAGRQEREIEFLSLECIRVNLMSKMQPTKYMTDIPAELQLFYIKT